MLGNGLDIEAMPLSLRLRSPRDQPMANSDAQVQIFLSTDSMRPAHSPGCRSSGWTWRLCHCCCACAAPGTDGQQQLRCNLYHSCTTSVLRLERCLLGTLPLWHFDPAVAGPAEAQPSTIVLD